MIVAFVAADLPAVWLFTCGTNLARCRAPIIPGAICNGTMLRAASNMDTSDGVANKFPCKSGQECKTGDFFQTTVIKSISPSSLTPEIFADQSVIKREARRTLAPFLVSI